VHFRATAAWYGCGNQKNDDRQGRACHQDSRQVRQGRSVPERRAGYKNRQGAPFEASNDARKAGFLPPVDLALTRVLPARTWGFFAPSTSSHETSLRFPDLPVEVHFLSGLYLRIGLRVITPLVFLSKARASCSH
jgi:hypothetical protein